MSDKRKRSRSTLIKAVEHSPIMKAEQLTAMKEDPFYGNYEQRGILAPHYPMDELMRMVEYSTILQQCVEAYKRNIPGYGAEVVFIPDKANKGEDNKNAGGKPDVNPDGKTPKDVKPNNATAPNDEPVKKEEIITNSEDPEVEKQESLLKELMEFFCFDKSFEDVWGQAIEDREKSGNGFIEILRDAKNLPVGGENIDPTFMRVTTLGDQVEVTYKRLSNEGTIKEYKRWKRFRRFVQIVGQQYIWFKEFGDPRFMDRRSGEFTPKHNGDFEANEVIHLKIGNGAYGIPRWIGQLIHMYGSRKAEELNYNYFKNGRHTPAAVVVSNGMLTEDSLNNLQSYADDVKGVENAHKFLIIEAEGLEDGVLPGEDRQGVKVELKPLAEMLQKDALFLEYDDGSRMKVQSAFRLPDIYVGRSQDFNRATADTARQVTEEQVFEPERNSLEFIINKILFEEYGLTSVRVQFKKPEINDPEGKALLLNAFNAIGAVAPNDVREEVGKIVGKELKPFDLETETPGLGDLPLTLSQAQAAQTQQAHNMEIQSGAAAQSQKESEFNMQQQAKAPKEKPVKKEESYYKDEFLNVVKQVRMELEEIKLEQTRLPLAKSFFNRKS